MKKYIYLLMAVCTLAFAGCNDDDDPAAPVLEIVTSDIGFEAAGGTGSITLKSTDTFSAVSDKGWLTITGTTATAINYSVAESSEALQRSANITVTAGNQSKRITILQQGAIFSVDTESISVDPAGENPTVIAYDTSMQSDPKVTIPEDATGWLSASVKDGKITLNAVLNYTEARSTVITVTQGWKPVEITVTQDMVDLVDTKQIAPDREAAEVVVTPTRYMALATESWSVRTSDSWITLDQPDQESFTVGVTENTSGALRSGTIEVLNAENEVIATLSVSQKIYSYEFFIGDWTMVYNNNNRTASVTLAANDDQTGYIMSGLALDMELGYVDSGNSPQLTWVVQYLGSANASTHYYLCPWCLAGEGNFTWAPGAGADLIYNMNESNQTLILEDNGVGAIADVVTDSFLIAIFNTIPASGSGYAGAAVQYPYISGFIRTPSDEE